MVVFLVVHNGSSFGCCNASRSVFLTSNLHCAFTDLLVIEMLGITMIGYVSEFAGNCGVWAVYLNFVGCSGAVCFTLLFILYRLVWKVATSPTIVSGKWRKKT